MQKKGIRRAYCPVDYAFQRIGGKYKGRILWALRADNLRFGQLKKAIEGVSTKMLTQALKELKMDGLIKRKVYMEVPLKVEYSLTDAAKQLVPSIDLLRIWAEQQIGQQ